MRFNVAQLLLGPTGGVREYDLDDDISGLDPLIVPHSTLVGHVRFTHVGPNVLVEGSAYAELELICVRCAEPFIERVDIQIMEEFEPSIDVLTGRVLPDTHEDPALVIDKHNMLDLSEVVRQNLLLAMEDHPRCREDCAGICPHCGRNLNTETCICVDEPVDPRWAPLADLQAG